MTDTITPQQLRFERTLDAPVETVWRYLIEPELRAKWFMGGDTEPRVGGKFGLTFDHAALSDGDVPTPERYAKNVGKSWFETIEAIDPPHRLAFSWDGGAAGSVLFELAPLDGGRTQLTLAHSGLRGRRRRAQISAADGDRTLMCCNAGWQANRFPISGRSTPRRRRRAADAPILGMPRCVAITSR